MISLFADLLLCRGARRRGHRFQWRKPRPIHCAAGPAFSSAPEPKSSCKELLHFRFFFDYSSNPMAAVVRVGAKFSFKRVVLCL